MRFRCQVESYTAICIRNMPSVHDTTPSNFAQSEVRVTHKPVICIFGVGIQHARKTDIHMHSRTRMSPLEWVCEYAYQRMRTIRLASFNLHRVTAPALLPPPNVTSSDGPSCRHNRCSFCLRHRLPLSWAIFSSETVSVCIRS